MTKKPSSLKKAEATLSKIKVPQRIRNAALCTYHDGVHLWYLFAKESIGLEQQTFERKEQMVRWFRKNHPGLELINMDGGYILEVDDNPPREHRPSKRWFEEG